MALLNPCDMGALMHDGRLLFSEAERRRTDVSICILLSKTSSSAWMHKSQPPSTPAVLAPLYILRGQMPPGLRREYREGIKRSQRAWKTFAICAEIARYAPCDHLEEAIVYVRLRLDRDL